jgi:hypothetical protein
VALGSIAVVVLALVIVDVSISKGSGTGTVSVGGGSAHGKRAPVTASGHGVRTGGATAAGGDRGSGNGSFFGSSSAVGSTGNSVNGSSFSGTPAQVAVAATQALTSYLQGLSHLDVQQVASSSDRGPFAMAGILLDAAAINSERGATTTMALGPSSFAATTASGSTQNFDGSVTLTTTISGPKGNGTFTDTISGPLTVTDEAGRWRVTNFVYDHEPVQVWPENATSTVNGLDVSLGYLVSYGNTTAALITLRQISGSANVQLQAATLRAGSTAENGVGDFTGPPTPTGVLRFARISAPPTALTLLFTSSTGQSDYYDFTLS